MNEETVERVARALCIYRWTSRGYSEEQVVNFWEGGTSGSISNKSYWRELARAAIAAIPGWQPIETLPKGDGLVGKDFWLLRKHGSGIDGPTGVDFDFDVSDYFTHWAICEPPALPAPPEDSGA